MKALLPAINVRKITPHCCALCATFRYGNGWWECIRPNGPQGDTGNGMQYETVCDRFRHPKDECPCDV